MWCFEEGCVGGVACVQDCVEVCVSEAWSVGEGSQRGRGLTALVYARFGVFGRGWWGRVYWIISSLCDLVEYVLLFRRSDIYPLPTGLFDRRRGLSCISFESLERVSNSSFQIDE